jgi:hypothetical protein
VSKSSGVSKARGEFVPLSSLKGKTRTPKDIHAEIRRIYFRTRRETIQDDLAHAIALLKSLPDDEEREKASVYMEGLAEMRKDWLGKRKK